MRLGRLTAAARCSAGTSAVRPVLAGEFGYVDASPVRGTFTAEEPFPVRLDLGRLN